MAVFAKYDGIDGESKDAQHSKWVDVLSLDWGAHQPETSSTGQGRRRGAVIVEDMVVTIEYEKAAPKLLDCCLRGVVVPKLEVELTATVAGARATYLRYEMKNVSVTSYHVSASGTDEAGRPMVSIANAFEEIKVTYTEFSSSGVSAGNVVTDYRAGRAKGVAARPKAVAAPALAAKPRKRT